MWHCSSASTCPATCCNLLQQTATDCNTLQHTATHCNTLQHTARVSPHALQLTATRCTTQQKNELEEEVARLERRRSQSLHDLHLLHASLLLVHIYVFYIYIYIYINFITSHLLCYGVASISGSLKSYVTFAKRAL